jgi:hypothetical protein
MRVGPLIGEHLLDIAQSNISKGDVEYALSVYPKAFGMQKEHALMILKNQAVVVADEDGEGVSLRDDPELIAENAHNILDWATIIEKRQIDIYDIIYAIHKTANDFMKLYNGNIEDYSILDMMSRYFDNEQLKTIGKHNIAARMIGSPDGKICDRGNSNPTSVWERIEYAMETEDNDLSKWEKILFYTVHYNKLIKMLHKEYMNFENTYLFLVENEFIKKPSRIEHMFEMVVEVLWKFSDTSTGYYHPLCNTGLYEYKEKLSDDLMKTKFGKEFAQNGIIKKDIMDGYDAGWLSPDGEFYGANGETSSMIHMNLAEQIFNAPCNIYAVRMAKDGVSIMGGIESPEYWLEKHGWVKIHHEDCYGSFIGHRNEEPTPDYPYAYNPTDIQIKMICDYADKFYGGKFYTEADCLGRITHTEPHSTYAVRQMDDLKIHEIFGR